MRIFKDATLKDCGQISVILAILCAFKRVFGFEPQMMAWQVHECHNIFGIGQLADSAGNHIALLVVFHETSLEIFYLRII